jgi:hypothetical protein
MAFLATAGIFNFTLTDSYCRIADLYHTSNEEIIQKNGVI